MCVILHSVERNTNNSQRKTIMTKTQEISRQILTLVSEGMDVIAAAKQVCGFEVVDTMITELYNELRAK